MDHQLDVSSLAFDCNGTVEDFACRIAALLLRVSLGTLFISHVYQKFFVLEGGLQMWWSDLEMNGYPRWVAYYVVSAEILGAALLIPGIKTTWVCLYALPLMIGARDFWYVRTAFNSGSASSDLPFVWSIVLVVQALLGDGAFALGPLM